VAATFSQSFSHDCAIDESDIHLRGVNAWAVDPWAVLNRNEPAFYCVPARAYEELMDLVDDLELGRIADVRLTDGQEPVRLSLDAL